MYDKTFLELLAESFDAGDVLTDENRREFAEKLRHIARNIDPVQCSTGPRLTIGYAVFAE